VVPAGRCLHLWQPKYSYEHEAHETGCSGASALCYATNHSPLSRDHIIVEYLLEQYDNPVEELGLLKLLKRHKVH
jgi:hypothetical protein